MHSSEMPLALAFIGRGKNTKPKATYPRVFADKLQPNFSKIFTSW